MQSSAESPSERSSIGVETAEKATGLLRYLADIEFPEMLCAQVFYSSRPHALIRNIHTGEASRAPGVRAVLLAKDVPGRNRLGDAPNDPPLLAEGRVRYAGEAIALLAAEEEGLADEALNSIMVEYEDLPPIFCPVEAMEPDSPSLHEGGNLLCHLRINVGEAEEALEECDAVVEHTFRIPPLEHLSIEAEGAVAVPGSDGMTIWAPTQAPFHVQRAVAASLAIPHEDVRVIQTPCGGGFGGKAEGSIAVAARAALLAHHLEKPVGLFASREESIISSTKRHACIIHYSLGAQRNGRLLAARARIFLEKGAYSHWGGPIPSAARRAAYHIPGPYVVPNVKVDLYCVHTNRQPGGIMRGPGGFQVTFATESSMDAMARKLGMDPMEFRMLNSLYQGAAASTGPKLDHSVGIKETIRAASRAARWGRRGRRSSSSPSKRRGMGIGCCWFGIGNPDPAGARVQLGKGGKFRVAGGLVDMGQGSKAAMAQVAAHALGVSPGKVYVQEVDTRVDPYSAATTSSKGTTFVGNAVLAAAADARRNILRLASEILEADENDLTMGDERIWVRSFPKKNLSLEEAALALAEIRDGNLGEGRWAPPPPEIDKETGRAKFWHVFSYGTQIAEVEVDVEVGEVRLLNLTAAHDVGRAINPLSVEGQIHGGVAMGVGAALMEEVYYENGTIAFPSMAGYLIPTSLDLPEIFPLIVEVPNKLGPLGAKGAGEPPILPTAAAIANAICDATGIRITELPLTAERLRLALKKRGAEGVDQKSR